MNELGHDFDDFYVCRVCGIAYYDALMGQIVCTAADEPVIVHEETARG